MAKIQQIAQEFIDAAKKHPERAPDILKRAANTFMGLAMDPKNQRAAKKLHSVGLDFAQAASQPRPPTVSDFAALLQETVAAYEEVGNHDEQGLIARRREIHDERDLGAPRVSISPESFNEDATLGRSAVIQSLAGLTTAQLATAQLQQAVESQTVLFWQGTKRESQAIAIDVGLVNPVPLSGDDIALPNSVRLWAEAEFGADGNRSKFKFDIGNGKRATILGNYASVVVGADAPLKGFPTVPVSVGASMGAFAAPSQAPLIRTRYVDALDPNTNTPFIAIPTKGTVLLPVLSTLGIGETAQIKFFGYGGGATALCVLYIQQSQTTYMPPFPIPGEFSFIKVAHQGAQATNFRLPFQLSA